MPLSLHRRRCRFPPRPLPQRPTRARSILSVVSREVLGLAVTGAASPLPILTLYFSTFSSRSPNTMSRSSSSDWVASLAVFAVSRAEAACAISLHPQAHASRCTLTSARLARSSSVCWPAFSNSDVCDRDCFSASTAFFTASRSLPSTSSPLFLSAASAFACSSRSACSSCVLALFACLMS